jgi:hypothetical protein
MLDRRAPLRISGRRDRPRGGEAREPSGFATLLVAPFFGTVAGSVWTTERKLVR